MFHVEHMTLAMSGETERRTGDLLEVRRFLRKQPDCRLDDNLDLTKTDTITHKQFAGATNGKRGVVDIGPRSRAKILNHEMASLIEESPVTARNRV